MKKKQRHDSNDDLDLTLETEESEDAEADDDRKFTLEGALDDARRSPGFKEAVFSACDAARAAAAVAILKYTEDAAELMDEWDLDRSNVSLYHFRWALREAACKKFLRTVHKRFPFSEVGDVGDAS